MRTDLAVIGAGPAGLAAALAAERRGLRVALVDAAPEPGGQFYRQPAPALRAERPQALHHQWRTWTRLRDRLATSSVRLLTEHHVWRVERTPEALIVHALLGPEQEEPAEVRARAVLLATGGYETVLPFPGWTLPGVLTAGGAQAMLKGGLVVPGRTAVVAGTGPLLLPVATGLAAAGVRVGALVESAGPGRMLRHAGPLAGKLPEGAGCAARLLRHRVPVLARHTVLRAHGEEQLTGVTVAALDARGRVRPGTERRLPCDTLAVSHGMLPHTDLAETLGCRLDGLTVAVDAEQRTDVPGVWAAGEATGVGGARLALAEGHIAGRSIAARLRDATPIRGSGPRRPGYAPGCARAPARSTPCSPRPPAGRSGSPTTPWSAAARRSPRAPSARASHSAPGTPARSSCSPGPGWAGARAGCAHRRSRASPAANPPSRRPFARPVPLGVLARQHEEHEEHEERESYAPREGREP
ncbi:NAD(P)/FAD-dependent oxidoreductase [Streptomyces sp. KM77-8]|uniref:NAD(P)/FAD-dependent oxidoreductase n=1 Tax=Streptomyces haneummycinicus TaxID=3074435 RepID=A0AAT9HIT4_9ACTN